MCRWTNKVRRGMYCCTPPHRREILKTISAHKDKQLYTIDGPSAKVPLFTLMPVSNTQTFAPAPPSGKSDSDQETNPRCRGERPSRNSKPSSGDFSASHLAVTGSVKKSASWSAVPTFTTLNSPLLTLSCNPSTKLIQLGLHAALLL